MEIGSFSILPNNKMPTHGPLSGSVYMPLFDRHMPPYAKTNRLQCTMKGELFDMQFWNLIQRLQLGVI